MVHITPELSSSGKVNKRLICMTRDLAIWKSTTGSSIKEKPLLKASIVEAKEENRASRSFRSAVRSLGISEQQLEFFRTNEPIGEPNHQFH